MSYTEYRSVRAKEAANVLGVGVSTLWRWVKEVSDFPQPARLSARCTVFELDKLLAWRDAKMTAKTSQQTANVK